MTAPEPSREDLYEAAVRAVLDLCDEKDVIDPDEGRTVAWGQIDSREIRGAIAAALAGAELVPDPEPPVSISGPGAASDRLSVPELLGGPEQGTGAWAAHGGEPVVVAQIRLEAIRRQQRGGWRK